MNIRTRVRNYLDEKAFLKRASLYQEKGAPLFQVVMIQTNYICTRKCSFCHYGMESRPKPIQMENDLFLKIVGELKALDYKGRVSLFEINEPLTDKRFFERAAFVKSELPETWQMVVTNGDLLNDEKLLELGQTQDKIIINSYDEKARVKNLALIQNTTPEIRETIVHQDRVDGALYNSRGGNVMKFFQDQNVASRPCELPNRVLYIKPDGTVTACWSDFFNVQVMGNVAESSLLDVWYSNEFLAMRDNINRGNRAKQELCAKCDYNGAKRINVNPKAEVRWLAKA